MKAKCNEQDNRSNVDSANENFLLNRFSVVHCCTFILNFIASFQAINWRNNWAIINLLILLVKIVDLNVLDNFSLKVRFYGFFR